MGEACFLFFFFLLCLLLGIAISYSVYQHNTIQFCLYRPCLSSGTHLVLHFRCLLNFILLHFLLSVARLVFLLLYLYLPTLSFCSLHFFFLPTFSFSSCICIFFILRFLFLPTFSFTPNFSPYIFFIITRFLPLLVSVFLHFL